MLRIHTLLLALVVLAVVPASLAKAQGRNKQHKAQPPAPAQPQSAAIVDLPPAPPPTPEQGPSSPPEVSFQNGQLTIVARNSTMSDVLNAVKQKTGAAVEMPTVSSERVVGRFGPGAARDVMAQLLNGSHYDYVLVGSPADPGALEKVVLMARVSGPQPTEGSSTPPAQPANPVAGYSEQPLPAVPDVETDATQDDTGAEAPVLPPDVQQGQDDQSQQPERQGMPMVKTPEQLLRELQQQQQQQQEQNIPPGAQPQQ